MTSWCLRTFVCVPKHYVPESFVSGERSSKNTHMGHCLPHSSTKWFRAIFWFCRPVSPSVSLQTRQGLHLFLIVSSGLAYILSSPMAKCWLSEGCESLTPVFTGSSIMLLIPNLACHIKLCWHFKISVFSVKWNNIDFPVSCAYYLFLFFFHKGC